jgi:hypothetical protein
MCYITWWVFLRIGIRRLREGLLENRTREGRQEKRDRCVQHNRHISDLLRYEYISGRCASVRRCNGNHSCGVPSFPTRTSWGQAWSGLPTPTATHGSHSCGRTRLVSSVSVCVHRRASPTSTCLSVWRFHSAGRDLPCPRPNEREGVDLPTS